MKYHRRDGLNHSNVFSCSFRGQKSMFKMMAVFISGEASFPGLQRDTFLLCPHMAHPLCMYNPGVSSSYKDIGLIG